MSLCDCVMSVPNCQYKTKIINLLLVDQLLFRFYSPLKKKNYFQELCGLNLSFEVGQFL